LCVYRLILNKEEKTTDDDGQLEGLSRELEDAFINDNDQLEG
jgi:hypothetical protein